MHLTCIHWRTYQWCSDWNVFTHPRGEINLYIF